MGMYDEMMLDEMMLDDRDSDGHPMICQTKAWHRELRMYESSDKAPTVRVDGQDFDSYVLLVDSTVEQRDESTVYVVVIAGRIVSINFTLPSDDDDIAALPRFSEWAVTPVRST